MLLEFVQTYPVSNCPRIHITGQIRGLERFFIHVACDRQKDELKRFAERAGYEVLDVFMETGSGVRVDRAERRKVMALAQAREIDAILVTELSRWGRSTIDLISTLQELESYHVSLIAITGMTFDLATPHGRMLATVLAGISEFERDLISERVKSGLAAARARGKVLGRQKGERPKSDSEGSGAGGRKAELSVDRP
jgi:DNA invertase Pin-like site-specific DNA recombinase